MSVDFTGKEVNIGLYDRKTSALARNLQRCQQDRFFSRMTVEQIKAWRHRRRGPSPKRRCQKVGNAKKLKHICGRCNPGLAKRVSTHVNVREQLKAEWNEWKETDPDEEADMTCRGTRSNICLE